MEQDTPLDKLSEIALRFLLDRTDWSEPYAGIGFASEFKKEVERALNRKTKVKIW